MNEFIKQNWFKLGLLIILLSIAFGIYLLISKNEKADQSNELQLKETIAYCNEKGEVFSEKFKSKIIAEAPYINYFVTPQFHYSQEDQSCISENGYNYPTHGGDGTYMQIANVDNGTIILRSTRDIQGRDIDFSQGIVSYEDFMARAVDIMSK